MRGEKFNGHRCARDGTTLRYKRNHNCVQCVTDNNAKSNPEKDAIKKRETFAKQVIRNAESW